MTLRDPLTGDEITTSGSLMIRLPISYKTFSSENALEFRAKKQVLQNGESIQGVIYPRHGQWDSGMVGKYGYQIIHRVSRRVPADAHGSRDLYRITTTDTIMASGTLITDTFSQKLIAYPPGAYLLQTFPLTRSGAIIPDTARSESEFSIIGNALNIPSPTVRVISEKPLYAPGEMARVFVTVPFTGSLLLLTLER